MGIGVAHDHQELAGRRVTLKTSYSLCCSELIDLQVNDRKWHEVGALPRTANIPNADRYDDGVDYQEELINVGTD